MLVEVPRVSYGLDVSKRKVDICAVGADGKVLLRAEVPARPPDLQEWFAGAELGPVAIEMSTSAQWIAQLLRGLGFEVIIANPRSLRLIYADVKKSDAVDAEKLARLVRADRELLSPVLGHSEQVLQDLTVLGMREMFIRQRTRLVNWVRSKVELHGSRLPSCDAAVFYRKMWDKVPEELRGQLWPAFDMLTSLAEAIKSCDQQMREIAKRYPVVERLQQVDRVGPITAVMFVLLIEDPHRFKRSRDVASFFGLCPRSDQSGDSNPQLPISKRGNRTMRALLVQCAQQMLGPFGKDSDLRRYGLRLAARAGGGRAAKKRAVIAVARKLAVLLHRLWVTNEDYVPVGYREQSRRQAAKRKEGRRQQACNEAQPQAASDERPAQNAAESHEGEAAQPAQPAQPAQAASDDLPAQNAAESQERQGGDERHRRQHSPQPLGHGERGDRRRDNLQTEDHDDRTRRAGRKDDRRREQGGRPRRATRRRRDHGDGERLHSRRRGCVPETTWAREAADGPAEARNHGRDPGQAA